MGNLRYGRASHILTTGGKAVIQIARDFEAKPILLVPLSALANIRRILFTPCEGFVIVAAVPTKINSAILSGSTEGGFH